MPGLQAMQYLNPGFTACRPAALGIELSQYFILGVFVSFRSDADVKFQTQSHKQIDAVCAPSIECELYGPNHGPSRNQAIGLVEPSM